MFDKNRYITKGVNEKIPLNIQDLIWLLIETMKIDVKDYLQVFELEKIIENGMIKQKIVHTQEQPVYKKDYIIPFKTAITAKLFVIDDGDHSTMLIAEEY